MNSNEYLLGMWKSNVSTNEYGLAKFNPATKTFSKISLTTPLPQSDSVNFIKSPILDKTNNIAYWFAIKTNTDPSEIRLYVIDLTTNSWQLVQSSCTTSYYWTSCGMNFLQSGKIFISGGTTSNDFYTNFYPVNGTILVTPSSATGIKNESSRRLQSNLYILKQNYPNPFNPSTTLEFSLPKSGMTTLKIYNLLGHEVATLINEYCTQGQSTIKWDASNYASGLYIYRLQSGAFSETMKMLLLK